MFVGRFIQMLVKLLGQSKTVRPLSHKGTRIAHKSVPMCFVRAVQRYPIIIKLICN